MTNFIWILYIIDVMNSITVTLTIFVGVSFLALMLQLLAFYLKHEDDNLHWNLAFTKLFKITIGILISSIVILNLMPSTITMYAFAANIAVSEISQTEAGKQMSSNAQTIVLDGLKLIQKKKDDELNSK